MPGTRPAGTQALRLNLLGKRVGMGGHPAGMPRGRSVLMRLRYSADWRSLLFILTYYALVAYQWVVVPKRGQSL